MSGTDPVVVARFGYRHEAELALGFLEDSGISAALFVDDAGGAEVGLAFANPARIVVAREGAEAARKILRAAGFETAGDR